MKNKQIVTLAVGIINLIAVNCNAQKSIQQDYYEKYLHPILLNELGNSNLPDEYHINNIPCISYQNAYCASAALQMVAEQKGNIENIDHINWLMGFTYSFYFFNNNSFALPYNDPETGYVNASSYLGLKRNYLITSDSIVFITNLKKQLTLNNPLRIALNSSTLHDVKGFTPHSILVVGYSKDTIYYYETGIKDRKLLNYSGERVEISKFLSSIRSISSIFNYPWLYNMTVFDSSIQNNDLEKVWIRNGELLIGNVSGPVSTGSKGIKNFSEYIINNELKESQYFQLAMVLDMGRYTRSDNANYIRTNYTRQKFQNIADLFDKSSSLFKEAKQAMQVKDKNTVVEKLNEISEIEYTIGKLLTNKEN